MTRIRQHALGLFTTSSSQVLSSLSNLAISAALGRAAGATEVGRYALAFGFYLIALGLARSLAGEALLSVGDQRETSTAAALAVASQMLVACVCTVLLWGAAAVTSNEALGTMACVLPVVLFQDVLRYVAFFDQRPQRAAMMDGLWSVVSIACYPVIASNGTASFAVWCWGGGALVSVLISAGWSRKAWALPTFARAQKWFALNRKVSLGLAGESVIYAVFTQSFVVVLAGVGGLATVGALRITQSLLAPLQILASSVTYYFLPAAARAGGVSHGYARSAAARLALCAIVLAVPMLLLAEPLQRIVYGPDIDYDGGLYLFVAVQIVGSFAALAFVVRLRAIRSPWQLATGRAVSGATALAVVLVIGKSGAVGAAIALAAGSAVFLAVIVASSARSLDLGCKVRAA